MVGIPYHTMARALVESKVSDVNVLGTPRRAVCLHHAYGAGVVDVEACRLEKPSSFTTKLTAKGALPIIVFAANFRSIATLFLFKSSILCLGARPRLCLPVLGVF